MQGVDYIRETNLDPQQSEVIRMMTEGIRSIDQIIIGLLQATALPSVELALHSMREAIESALQELQERLIVQHIEVVRQIDPNLPLVLLDRARMKTALVHVLQNAMQAMPDGGTLGIRCAPERLLEPGSGVGIRTSDRFAIGQTIVRCAISDTGPGIPESQRAMLFEPFVTTKPSGWGLGLAVARSIVKAHGGEIAIQTAEQGGTCAVLSFPLAPEAKTQNKKRVLLIDDDIALSKMMQLNLERCGEFEVTTVFLGNSGIERAIAQDYDLVITDFQLPDINGDAVLSAIKAKKPKLPVLLFSIYHDLSAPISPEMKARADGLLKKPIDHKQLYSAIEEALKKAARGDSSVE